MVQSTPAIAPEKAVDPKLNKIKLAFLYVLIGGLIISALISVIAILIGQFNEAVVKALLTTFIFVTHSLLILALVWADKLNKIGRSILPTTIFVAVLANMVTSTLGTWELWGPNASWRSFLLYTLLIGSAFLVTGTLRLRVASHKAANISTIVSIAAITLFTLVMIPWIVMPDADWINAFYYRLVGAAIIITATSLSLSVIFNRIAAANNKTATKIPRAKTPGGMLAIYIVMATVIGSFWFFGLIGVIISAATIDAPAKRTHTPYTPRGERNKLKDY